MDGTNKPHGQQSRCMSSGDRHQEGFGERHQTLYTCTATLGETWRMVVCLPLESSLPPVHRPLLLYINSTWNMFIISSLPEHSRLNVSSEPAEQWAQAFLPRCSLSHLALLLFNIQLLSLLPRRAASPRQHGKASCVCLCVCVSSLP